MQCSQQNGPIGTHGEFMLSLSPQTVVTHRPAEHHQATGCVQELHASDSNMRWNNGCLPGRTALDNGPYRCRMQLIWCPSVLISPWSADSAEHAVHSPSSSTGRLWNAAGHVSREEDVVTDTPSHVIGCIFYFGQCELIVCNTAHWLLLFGLILILDFANTPCRHSRHAGDHSLWIYLAIANQYVTIRILKRLKTNQDPIFILIYNVCCFWCRAVLVNVNLCDNRWQSVVDSNISPPVSSHQRTHHQRISSGTCSSDGRIFTHRFMAD